MSNFLSKQAALDMANYTSLKKNQIDSITIFNLQSNFTLQNT